MEPCDLFYGNKFSLLLLLIVRHFDRTHKIELRTNSINVQSTVNIEWKESQEGFLKRSATVFSQITHGGETIKKL
jgi:hypothetical protein